MTTMTMEPGKFLDERITVSKEHTVRAIGQNRYAELVGSLELTRDGYTWSLTFEDVRPISSDGSSVPAEEPGLATVFPNEASFTIYADGAPAGFGL